MYKWQTWVEQPVSEYGDPMVEIATDSDIIYFCPEYNSHYAINEETLRLYEDEITESLLPSNEIPGIYNQPFTERYGYQFRHLNRYIPYYEISDTTELLPIYTFNTHQLEEANNILLSMNFIYLIIYAIAAAATLTVYRKKMQKYA